MSDFYQAAIPDPFTILGLRLRPYCLGHIILLHRVQSAFVVGPPVQQEDLVTSVFFCSQTYEEGVRALDNPKLPKFMRRWERKIGRFDFETKCKEFANYIQAHSKAPLFTVEEGKSKASACPIVQSVKVALLSQTNLTESEILNRCWSLCLWDWLTILAQAGKVQIMDPKAVDDAQEVANRLFKKFNPQGDKCPSE